MTKCPPTSQIEDLLADRLDFESETGLAEHVQSCDACQQQLELLTACEIAEIESESPESIAWQEKTAFLRQHKRSLKSDTDREVRLQSNSDILVESQPPQTAHDPTLENRPSIPGYEILRTLGRGGMGVVYLARQLRLNRLVALKMILAGNHAGPEQFARFVAEAKVIAQLRHANIIQIHEIGDHQGLPYFAMEYADGGNLHELIHAAPRKPMESARLIEVLAGAVAVAHDKGIIHRDLKPANVLLQMSDCNLKVDRTSAVADSPAKESQSAICNLQSSVPKITDFGLAKQLDSDLGLSRQGLIAGTPSYMSPEQASGRSQDVGPATDVYALGAILYEMLTGRAPFKAATPLETLQQVQTDDPVPLRQLQSNVPRDLEVICLKAMAKERNKRYASATDLADDLQRFQSGKPIHARPIGSIERAGKWMRRHPMTTFLLTMLAISLIVGVSGVLWAYSTALHERNLAKQATEKAKSEAASYRIALANNRLILAQATWNHGDVRSAHNYLNQIPKDLRSCSWEWARRIFEGCLVTMNGHKETVTAVAVAPDGSMIASGDRQGMVRLWNASTGKLMGDFHGKMERIDTLKFSPSGKLLAVGSGSARTKVWDVQTRRVVHSLPEARRLAFHPRRNWIALIDYKQTRIYDLDGRRNLFSWDPDHNETLAGAYSSDGSRLITAGTDKTIKLWEFKKNGTQIKVRLLRSFSGHADRITCVAFSPDSSCIASAGNDKTVRVWNTNNGKMKRVYRGHSLRIFALCFSPDGQRLTSGGKDRTIKVWDMTAKATMPDAEFTLRGHLSSVMAVAFTPDGQRIVSGGTDQTVRVWDSRPHYQQWTLRLPGPELTSMALSPNGDWLGIATESTKIPLPAAKLFNGPKVARLGHAAKRVVPKTSRIILCNLRRPAHRIEVLKQFDSDIRCLSFGGDDYLAAAAKTSVKLFRAKDGTLLREFPKESEAVWSLAFRPDNRVLAVASEKQIVLRSVPAGNLIGRLKGHDERIRDAAWSDDGKWLASGSGDGTIRIWDPESKNCVKILRGHAKEVDCVAFAPAGNVLASGSRDKTIRLWNAATGKEIRTLTGHTALVRALVFTRDGRELVSGGPESAIRIWNLHTGQQILSIQESPQGVRSLACSPDGKRIFSLGSQSSTIKCWNSFSSATMNSFGQRVMRPDNLWHLKQAQRHLRAGRVFASMFHFRNVVKK